MNAKPKIERILFATDFLESSRLALDYAVAFAHHFQATLRMLHVVELLPPAREAEAISSRPSVDRKLATRRLEALAAGVRRLGIQTEVVVRDGLPADEIIDQACNGSCDLLVLGVHGVHRGIEHLIVGSNTEKILLSSTCPTLTVGAHVLAGVDLSLDFDKVLHLADSMPEAEAASPWASFLADQFHVPLQTAELQNGLEPEDLLARACSEHASLIVLGVRAHSMLRRHLQTSFVYRLIAEATCPVLSILRSPAPQNTSTF